MQFKVLAVIRVVCSIYTHFLEFGKRVARYKNDF